MTVLAKEIKFLKRKIHKAQIKNYNVNKDECKIFR